MRNSLMKIRTNFPFLIQQPVQQNKLMASSYTIFSSTEVDTTPIYNYGNILGRILWDGLLTPGHLEMLILFRIFDISSIGMGYMLLRMVTQLLIIFRPLLLEQRSQYGRKLRLHVNYGNLKLTNILQKAILICI